MAVSLIEGFEERLRHISKELENKLDDEKNALLENLPVPAPSGRETITNAELLATCQTGDLILWSSSGPLSHLIRFVTQSAFSHASVVFRGPLAASEEGTAAATKPRLLQATWAAFHEDALDDHRVVAEQVMLNDLAEVLAANEADSEPGTLRRLHCDGNRSSVQQSLAAFITEKLGAEYPGAGHEMNFIDFVNGLLHLPQRYPNDYFCSELVAAALQRMGVLDMKRADDAWSPGDLSERHDALLAKHLSKGFSFAPETRIVAG